VDDYRADWYVSAHLNGIETAHHNRNRIMKKFPRKRRTREHVIADLSVNHVERHALLSGFVVEEIIHDYGVDLNLITFNTKGEIEAGEVLLQVKASDRLTLDAKRNAFGCRIDRRDLARWLTEPLPVVLVVYDARKDVAYWLYVQSYFRRQKPFNLFAAAKTVTLWIPTANVVAETAMRRFAGFRDRVVRQMGEVIHEE
jgi:Domain of unknown function (DUF4365)